MIRTKYLGLGAVAVLGVSLAGCFTDSSDDAAPTVSSALYVSGKSTEETSTDTSFTLVQDSTYHLAGTVKDVKSWSWTVVREADGKTVDTLLVDAPNGSGSTDIGSGSAKTVQFKVTSKWGATGIYDIQGVLTGTDGSSSLTTDVKVKAPPGGTNTTTTALTQFASFQVGGKSSTAAPSSISLGDGKAYKAAELSATDRSNIDLYVTSDEDGYALFESTAEAVLNCDVTDAAWGAGKATLIVKVATVPATLEDAKGVALGTSQSATLADASAYVAKTVAGTYYVLKTSAAAGAGDGITVTVTLLK